MSSNGSGIVGGAGGYSMRRSSSQSQKMEMPKLQARLNAPFPPPHKTQLPPRYQVNPGPWRPSCRRNAWIFLGILLVFSFCLFIFSMISGGGLAMSSHFRRTRSTSSTVGYTIIIDAGSSGSRLHVFKYVRGQGQGALSLPLVKPKESPSKKIRPGLSSFASDPMQAGQSLEPLLEFARGRVPASDRDSTRVYLMATAGLRLLSNDDQHGILDSCRETLRGSDFSFRDEWASVITGTEEGIYAWIAANYALGTIGKDPQETVGIVELGGASAQVTFIPKDVPPPAFRHDISLLGVPYTLYTYSFLQFGQEAAWERLVDLMLTGALKPALPALQKGVVLDPCTPRGYVVKKKDTPLPQMAAGKGIKKPSLTVVAAGNFTACRHAAFNLLHTGSEGCLYKKCSIGSAFVPELRGNFFATENFFYTSEFFGLPSTTSVADVESAGQHYCSEEWHALQAKHEGIEPDDLFKYCFSTAYIVALLHDTLGVDMHDDRVRFTNQVGEVALDWALGALISLIEGDDFFGVEPIWIWREGAFRIFSILGCVVGLGLVTWLVMRYRRPHVKTIYDLEKGRYITTATRGQR